MMEIEQKYQEINNITINIENTDEHETARRVAEMREQFILYFLQFKTYCEEMYGQSKQETQN